MKRLPQVLPSAMMMFAVAAMTACLPSQIIAQVVKQTKPISTPAAKRGYTISKETTYFTGPLKKDGTIDFVAAINEHFAEGVTHENNAARIIVPLLDPISWGPGQSEHRSDVLKALGLDPAQCTGKDAFADVASYFGKARCENQEFLQEHLAASQRPWTDSEFPHFKKWLNDNQEALARISSATHKERFFVPFVVEGDSDSLAQILLEHIQAIRGIARAYSFRANNHLGNRRWKEAWEDILTIKELGRLVGQGPTVIEGLVGVAITGIACHSATQFITAVDPKEVDWPALQESWQTRPIADVNEELGVTERAMFIQMACKMKDRPDEKFSEFEQIMPGASEFSSALPNIILVKTLRDMLKSDEVKLDEALRYANGVYDRAIAITEMPDAQARQVAFEALEEQISDPLAIQGKGKSPLAQVFFAKPQEPAHQFSNVILAFIFPSANTANRAEWRTEASQHVVELALAARVIEARTGQLPQSLRELEPLVEEATMVQPSTGATVAFRSEPKGILIYHWCANRVDNGGIIDGENPKDWGIRIAK